MAFVRPKRVNGKTYYQLVKNERVAGKHRQRVLVHLGRHPTVGDALEAWKERADWYRNLAARRRESVRSYKATARSLAAAFGGSAIDDNDRKLLRWGREAEEFDAKAVGFEEKMGRLKSLSGA